MVPISSILDTGLDAKLFEDATGFDYIAVDQTTYSFDTKGKLTSITDRTGTTVSITGNGIYSSNG